MRRSGMMMCLSVLFFAGFVGAVSALPYDAAESPPTSTLNPTTLILHCGIPDEFDPVHTVSVSHSEHQSVSAVPDAEHLQASSSPFVDQHAATVTAIPEPSTLVLLGVGLTGLIQVIRRRT